MELFIDILISAAVCAVILCFISIVKLLLFVPIRESQSVRTFSIVEVRGKGAELEQTVKSLDAVKGDGKMKIFIVDCGMDREARHIAEIIVRNKNEIVLCSRDELKNLIAETE